MRVGNENDSLVGVSAALGLSSGTVVIVNLYGSSGRRALNPDHYSDNLISLISTCFIY